MTRDKRLPDTTLSALMNKQGTNIEQFETYEPEWICMADVEPKNQPWFWKDIIPYDTLTLFAGHGGIGKSLILLYLAAKTTTGHVFSAGGNIHQLPKGSVILLSAEDDVEYQIRPKLITANADINKIHFIKSKIGKNSKKKKFIELDKDLHILEQKITQLKDVRFIIVDPVGYFMGDTKDHYNMEVANFLQPLIDLAKKHNIAIILNKHLRKTATNSKGATSAADEVGGAGAWTNTPRRCWLITNHHEDHDIKVISKMKDNLGKMEEDCLGYRIVSTVITHNNVQISTTELAWEDKLLKISAEEAVNEEKYAKTKLEAAIEYIYNYLKQNGQSVVAHIREKAFKDGIKEATFRRASEVFEQQNRSSLIITQGIKGAKMYNLKEE